jgi:hypothetical protein
MTLARETLHGRPIILKNDHERKLPDGEIFLLFSANI